LTRRSRLPRSPTKPSTMALRFLLSACLLLHSSLLLPAVVLSQETNDVDSQQQQQDEQQRSIATYDCVDPNNREIASVVRRGAITTVCLYVGPDGDWNDEGVIYKRFSVNLKADEFSTYEIPGSFDAMVMKSKKDNKDYDPDYDATHIFAASQSSLSFLRRYHDKTNSRIYPFLTAIVDVRDGIVRGIAWDDACVFCEKAECVPNTYNLDGSLATAEQINQPVDGCHFSVDECLGFAATGDNACDLRLHVVWTGTDVDGKVMLSSDSRFSMFPPNRVQENVNNSVNNMMAGLKTITGFGKRKLKAAAESLWTLKDKVTGSV